MGLKNTKDSYGLVSKALHWITALIILALVLVGLYMTQLAYSPFKLEIYALHKSFGILVLWLVGLRIIWKLLTAKPEAHPNHKWWEKLLAKLTHIFLYIAMIGMPLSGWLMSSAGEYPVPFFGIQMPDLVDKNPQLAGLMNNIHEILAYILIGAVLLHAVGALKHHFIDRDSTLLRMLVNPMHKVGPYLAVFLMIFFALSVGFLMMKGFSPNKSQAQTQATTSEATLEESVSSPVSKNWIVIEDKSSLTFKATVYGKEFTGEFKKFSSDIIFDPDNLPKSRVNIKIDLTTVNSDDEERDNSMMGKEWFDINQHPEAHFNAENFVKLSEEQYIANGQLTVKDKTLPVDLPFTLKIEITDQIIRQATVNGQVTLNRLDFGLGTGQWESDDSVGLEVKVHVNLTATNPI